VPLFHPINPWIRVLLEKLTVHSVSQDIPRLFLEPEGLFRVNYSPPEPDKSNPHPHTYFPKIYFNITLPLRLGLLSGLFNSGFQTTILYAFLISSMTAACPALLDLIILIIFSEECKLTWLSIQFTTEM
jgi:hypothetical protein